VNLTPNEVLIICLVALVVLGPKQLPGAIRGIAKGLADLRRFSSQVRSELDNVVKGELDNVVKGEVEQSHDEKLRQESAPLPSPDNTESDGETNKPPPSQ